VPDLVEEIVLPFEQAVETVARGVAAAQTALDRASIAMQKEIDADTELAGLGLMATWYQLPEVDFEMKITLSVHEKGGGQRGLFLAHYNASYKNRFSHDVTGTTTLKLKIRPVPAPVTLTGPPAPPS
jgi:hypothetical protein